MKTALRASFLLLCAVILCGSLLMWWRSYWTIDAVDWQNSARASQIMSVSGRLVFVHSDIASSGNPSLNLMFRSSPRTGAPPLWENSANYTANNLLGFEWTPQVTLNLPNSVRYRRYFIFPTSVVAIPWWSVSLLSWLPLLRFGFGYSRMLGRLGAGLCPVCGYDLRASPDRCPECGELANVKIEKPAASASSAGI